MSVLPDSVARMLAKPPGLGSHRCHGSNTKGTFWVHALREERLHNAERGRIREANPVAETMACENVALANTGLSVRVWSVIP